MPQTYAQMYTTVETTGASLPPVAIAVAVAAQAVLTEDPATPNHAARLVWAQRALIDVPSMAKKMIWGCIVDPNIQATMPAPGPTDAQIQTSINTLVNGYLNA